MNLNFNGASLSRLNFNGAILSEDYLLDNIIHPSKNYYAAIAPMDDGFCEG